MNWSIFLSAAGGCIVILVIFFACRHFMCWYWKINEIVELLRDVRDIMASVEDDAKDKAA